ncbi:MAG: hypothetical protein U0Z44_18280 [Kouleothrix sp.]
MNHPRVLLLDEPLGALDLKLRQQMQIELKAIQQQVGITFVYVTHDQEEALTMSDRIHITVFNNGTIEQIGAPAQITEHPATAFVAGFVGISNIVRGAAAQAITGSPQPFAIRPEKIRMLAPDAPVPPELHSASGHIETLCLEHAHALSGRSRRRRRTDRGRAEISRAARSTRMPLTAARCG